MTDTINFSHTKKNENYIVVLYVIACHCLRRKFCMSPWLLLSSSVKGGATLKKMLGL